MSSVEIAIQNETHSNDIVAETKSSFILKNRKQASLNGHWE